MKVHIDLSGDVIQTTVDGTISGPLILKIHEVITSHPDFSSDANRLWDLRDADFSHMMAAEVQWLRLRIQKSLESSNIKIAIVAISSFETKIITVLKSLSMEKSNSQIEVFDNMAEATQWCA